MLKSEIIFVIGGCRSGKSSFALDQADQMDGNDKYFIATSVPADPEMEKRVEIHQQQRGKAWHTIEEPVLIYESIDRYGKDADVILVDCLTLWVSNLLMQSCDHDHILGNVDRLVHSLDQCACPVFLVSNEVGTGIVPENQLARCFRDFAGLVNQRIARAADRVVTTIAGIPVQIKPEVRPA